MTVEGGDVYTGVKPAARPTVRVNATTPKAGCKPDRGCEGENRFSPCLALVGLHFRQRGGSPTRVRLRALLLRSARTHSKSKSSGLFWHCMYLGSGGPPFDIYF
jgi:hypothetical protein